MVLSFQDGKRNVHLPELQQFEPGHQAACHFPVERWPMTAAGLRASFRRLHTGIGLSPYPVDRRLTSRGYPRLKGGTARWLLTTACERASQWISLELHGELGRLEQAALVRHLGGGATGVAP